jgi:23S rRNA pseudouridine1911/1915/1917 synthase
MPWSMASWIEAEGACLPEGWLAGALNAGWTYWDRVETAAASVAAFYASRYPHSPLELWHRRLAAGEIHRNGVPLQGEVSLGAGDRLAWHRPPWWEEAVPAAWEVVRDDGDVLVIDKPAGLPVLPAGGWLEHTVLRLLERRHGTDPAGVPRPVHRLGRFTSGLLVCARQKASRRWLSARLRESTAALEAPREDGGEQPRASWPRCQKVYRALLVPGGLPAAMGPNEALTIRTPIGRRPHPRLGLIWCAAAGEQAGDLTACSTLKLLARGPEGDTVEVAIASGRPHQIRIHCAAIGAPLLGDPLYLPGGLAREEGLPGKGGYQLRAQRLAIQRPDGGWLRLEAQDTRGLPG